MNRYLARFTLAQKLLIGSAGFALPLAVLLYYTVAGFNRTIRDAEAETAGIEAMNSLRELAELVPLHQRLAAYDPGRAGKAAKQIDAAFERLGRTRAAIDRRLVAGALEHWQRLRESEAAHPEEADPRYTELRETITRTVKRLADSSGLVLDPEMESYYLMQVAVVFMPKIQDDLADVLLSIRRDLPKRGGVLAFTARLSKLDWAELEHIRETARSATAGMRSRIPQLIAAHAAATEAFLGKAATANLEDAASIEELYAAGDRLLVAGSSLWQASCEEAGALLNARLSENRTGRLIALLITLISASAAAGLMLSVARNTVRPLEHVAAVAGEIAAGRLKQAQRGVSEDELRAVIGAAGVPEWARDESWRLLHAFRAMCGSLDALLGDVRQSGVQVTGSATQIAAAIRQLEGMVGRQAASTREAEATSKEIYATVEELARRMERLSGMASDAVKLADDGMRSLGGITATIDTLSETADGLSGVLDEIRRQSERIGAVVEAITRIANRTNLLSLNAAIEAEKAGKHAAGFSVVALEVRRLADQTAVAALDIEESIGAMRQSVQNGVAAVEEYTAQVRTGTAEVGRTSESLGHLIEYTRKLGPHYEAVNAGMQGQSEGAGQITAAMRELSGAAADTSCALSELRAAAESLRGAVSVLRQGVARFSEEA